MYLSNSIVKNKAKEATLTYSTFEVVPVSKFPCPKSIVLFISMICHLDWIQNTIDINLIPRNHLDKLWFTFSEEVIVKFQYFFSKFTKLSTVNSKDGYVLVFVKISYYHKNMPLIYCWSEPNIMKIQNR